VADAGDAGMEAVASVAPRYHHSMADEGSDIGLLNVVLALVYLLASELGKFAFGAVRPSRLQRAAYCTSRLCTECYCVSLWTPASSLVVFGGEEDTSDVETDS
jgi:hypothetical protein